MTKELCYSADEEIFNFDDMGELIYLMEPKVGDTYWEAEKTGVDATFPINFHTVDGILEDFDERMYDELGEVYDNECSDVSDESKAELKALLEAWATKHLQSLSRYWLVSKPRAKQFTAEDLA